MQPMLPGTELQGPVLQLKYDAVAKTFSQWERSFH